MIIRLHKFNIHCTVNSTDEIDGRIPVLFIHGFGGSSEDWKDIFPEIDKSFFPFGIDLIGHGKSDSPDNPDYYNQQSIAEQINTILNFLQITEVVICGYSMGGRAALAFYNEFPDKVQGLILESTNPGIENPAEKEERVKKDYKLSEFLKNTGIDDFIMYWYDQPLFNTMRNLPPAVYRKIVENRKQNSPTGLINSLRAFGTGRMKNFRERLEQTTIPIKLIAGELDTKYTEINKSLYEKISHAEFSIVKSAGHNTHLENPAEFVSLTNSFLRNYFLK